MTMLADDFSPTHASFQVLDSLPVAVTVTFTPIFAEGDLIGCIQSVTMRS